MAGSHAYIGRITVDYQSSCYTRELLLHGQVNLTQAMTTKMIYIIAFFLFLPLKLLPIYEKHEAEALLRFIVINKAL